MTNADCPYKAECDRKGEHVAPNCPTSNADLIAEARKLDLPDCVCKSYPTGDKVCQFHREAAFEMRTLLPQLADALVTYHAEVRKRVIVNTNPEYKYWQCRACQRGWWENEDGGKEKHAPDCPACPMEDA